MNPIVARIEREGPVTFARFMELALYDGEHGYYTTGFEVTGRAGDFFTSSDLGPFFGHMLAEDAALRWRSMGCPGSFAITEYGAGRGFLARDILERLRERHPRLYEGLGYRIVEISPSLVRRQKENLRGFPVAWASPEEAIEPRRGIVIANELVDAFPVHRVRFSGGRLRESYVRAEGGRLVEEWRGPSGGLEDYLRMSGITLEEGQEAEINLKAKDWLQQAVASLEEGYLLVFDYGGEAADLYDPLSRPRGTLMTYTAHRSDADFLADPGRRDITAHVNFTALRIWGEELGLEVETSCRQGEYLLGRGLVEAVAEEPAGPEESFRRSAAIKRLILPEGMGGTFSVLVLHRI